MISRWVSRSRWAAIWAIRHRLIDEMNVEQRRGIADRGVAAVKDADLHQLAGRDIGSEGDANFFQRRPPRWKLVFKHPLAKFFAKHRPIVLEAEFVEQGRTFAVGRRRSDAIDHRVWKRDVGANPARKFRINQFREARHRVFADMAIAGNIVAGHHSKGRDSSRSSTHKARNDQSEHRLGRVNVFRVEEDVGVSRVEFLRGRRDVIAAFGNRQRYDSDPPGGRGHRAARRHRRA